MSRKDDVREFLISRRAHVTPEQAGITPFGDDRRVPGLRREEVAMLAGVSLDWHHDEHHGGTQSHDEEEEEEEEEEVHEREGEGPRGGVAHDRASYPPSGDIRIFVCRSDNTEECQPDAGVWSEEGQLVGCSALT